MIQTQMIASNFILIPSNKIIGSHGDLIFHPAQVLSVEGSEPATITLDRNGSKLTLGLKLTASQLHEMIAETLKGL